MLREHVYETFGVTDGRNKLSKRFPTGTAREKLLNMKFMAEEERREGNNSAGNFSVFDKVIKELYALNIN